MFAINIDDSRRESRKGKKLNLALFLIELLVSSRGKLKYLQFTVNFRHIYFILNPAHNSRHLMVSLLRTKLYAARRDWLLK